MTLFYVETSAMLKRFRPEVGTLFVEELITRKQTGEELLTSHFTILEVTGVASRMLRGRMVEASQYQRIVTGLLQEISDYRFTVLPVDEDIISDALRFYPEYPLRGSDAIHFAPPSGSPSNSLASHATWSRRTVSSVMPASAMALAFLIPSHQPR